MQDAATPSPDLFQEGLAAARNGWTLWTAWTAWTTPWGQQSLSVCIQRLCPLLSIIVHLVYFLLLAPFDKK